MARSLERAEETRRRMRDAAWSVFLQDGLAGTTVRAIAAELNCSAGSLYTYYADKEALLRDLALAAAGELERRAAEVASAPDRNAALREAATAVLEMFGAGGDAAELTCVLFPAEEPADEEFVRRTQGKLMTALAPLAAGPMEGGASAEEAGHSALADACFLFGLALFDASGRLDRFGVRPDELVDAYLRRA